MADVHVVFPQAGGVFVHDETQPVIKGHDITWHITSRNPMIASVRIEFQHPDATYFPVGGALQHWFQKPLARGNTIWGKVPGPPYVPQEGRKNKYTVKGLDASGNEVAWEDPVIIPDDP